MPGKRHLTAFALECAGETPVRIDERRLAWLRRDVRVAPAVQLTEVGMLCVDTGDSLQFGAKMPPRALERFIDMGIRVSVGGMSD